MAIVGIGLSVVATFVTLLYGSYAAWNWALADDIAKAHNWSRLLPDYTPRDVEQSGWQQGLIRRLAAPCKGKISPVFWAYLVFSTGFAGIHVYLAPEAAFAPGGVVYQ